MSQTRYHKHIINILSTSLELDESKTARLNFYSDKSK